MNKPKPTKPRVVYLIRNPDNPKRFLHYVGHSKSEVENFRKGYEAPKKCVVKFVEVCDERPN